MIDSRVLHDKFLIESQRINVSSDISIDTKAIDIYLNKALKIFIYESAKAAHYNKDANLLLKELEVPNKKLEIVDHTDYSVYVKHPDNLFRPGSYRVIASKEKCKEDILVYPVQRNEVQALRYNINWKPDFNFRETIYVKAGDGIEIITNGDFEIETVYLNYYKKHPLLSTPSLASNGYYVGSDGKKIKDDQGLLLEGMNVDDLLVQLAVLYVSGDINDMATFNTKKDEILSGLNYVKIKLL